MMLATKFSVIFCLVCGCLAQWKDPNWKYQPLISKHNYKYPPLPRSVPVFNLADSSKTPVSPPKVTSPDHSSSKGTAPAPAPETCKRRFGCADCNTAQVCRPTANGLVPIPETKLSCPPKAPYCNAATGSCSDIPDSTCGAKDDFICPDNGYFPDPKNCTIYHACNDFESQMFKCAEGEVYDPDNKVCSKSAVCNFSVACTGLSQSKLQMGNSHYFTYCSNGLPLMVSRCQNEYKLNTTSQLCEAICEKNGLMEDLEDCTKYYMCRITYITKDLSYPVRQNLACPAGEAFDPNSFQCVPIAMTQCKKP